MFHPPATEHTLFSNVYRMLSTLNRILGHKISINKCRKTKIISSVFLLHSMEVEVNNRGRRNIKINTINQHVSE